MGEESENMKEISKAKLYIKLPNITIVAKTDDDVNLRKGEYIKIQLGASHLDVCAVVTSSQYKTGKNTYQVDAEEVETVKDSKIREVFMV